MYQLRHVLYITDLDVKLKVEGEHLKLIYNDGRKQTVPLQHIDLIISFSYFSPSAALMELCAKKQIRFLYKGIIIKHNKTEPTYTKTSLFLCEKRRFFMAWTEKGVVTTI